MVSKGSIIRGQHISDIVQRVKAFFLEYYGDQHLLRTAYLVSPPYIISLPSLLKEKQLFRHIKSSIKYGALGAIIYCPFRCEKIYVKNHIRVFGLPDSKRKTAKIQGANLFMSGDEIIKEIEYRNQLKRSKLLRKNLPETFASSSSTVPWFVEEYIPGNKLSTEYRSEIIKSFITEELADYYRSFLKPVQLGNTISSLSISPDTLDEYWPGANRTILQKFQSYYWPVSVCHNDLSFGNMLQHNDQIYILDWETAKDNPVAYDFLSIVQSDNDLVSSVLCAMRKLNQSLPIAEDSTIPPEVQLIFASFLKLIKIQQQKEAIVQYHQVIREKSAREATNSVEADIHRKQKYIIEALSRI